MSQSSLYELVSKAVEEDEHTSRALCSSDLSTNICKSGESPQYLIGPQYLYHYVLSNRRSRETWPDLSTLLRLLLGVGQDKQTSIANSPCDVITGTEKNLF